MMRTPQYGRIAVGQRVRFDRVMAAPTPEPSASAWGRNAGPRVTVRTEHTVTDIQHCESGALVTLRHADGRGERAECFNSYGQMWGGFGGLVVIEEAPEQRALPGMSRRAA